MKGSDGEAGRSGGEPDEAISFEAALERLEGVVDRLEGGELPLEEALACFEEGVQLTRLCASRLETAERRIEVLLRDGDTLLARPFDEEDAAGGSEGEAEDAEEAEEVG